MQFMVTWTIDIPQKAAAESRFLETGAAPPAGVELLGRWHSTGDRRGFMLLESSDGVAVSTYMRTWNDLITFDITPVVNDEQLAKIMQS